MIYVCSINKEEAVASIIVQTQYKSVIWLCKINRIYIPSAVNMVSSNPCVGHSQRLKIFLLSKYTDELISAPKVMTFFPTLPSIDKNSERESNPMPQLLYMYLSRPALLFSFTDTNKQLPNVKSVFEFLNCTFNEKLRNIRNIQIYYLFRDRNIIC